jgi:hypothetical protein
LSHGAAPAFVSTAASSALDLWHQEITTAAIAGLEA